MNEINKGHRAGQNLMQLEGYKAFIPNPLPPEPPLALDAELVILLSQAEHALGKLSIVTTLVKNPDLFVYVFVQKEALLSSQIEGTQCSLEDLLDEGEENPDLKVDIEEVTNYIKAMNQGLKLLNSVPLSTRLMLEIHRVLLNGVRGSQKTPGEFRRSQNWIGSPGATIMTAQFIPPPPSELARCMSDLEKFVHSSDAFPPIIKAGLIHAQFETIHPFLDGNGRLGRLLITFLLCQWGVLDKPLLYLSYFFKAHRTEYYARLTDIRVRGDWEGWIKFFLRGVAESAKLATSAAQEIHRLHESDRNNLAAVRSTQTLTKTFDLFCNFPLLSLSQICSHLTVPAPTAQRAVDKLIDLKILREATGKQRNRKYVYRSYFDIIRRDTISPIG